MVSEFSFVFFFFFYSGMTNDYLFLDFEYREDNRRRPAFDFSIYQIKQLKESKYISNRENQDEITLEVRTNIIFEISQFLYARNRPIFDLKEYSKLCLSSVTYRAGPKNFF